MSSKLIETPLWASDATLTIRAGAALLEHRQEEIRQHEIRKVVEGEGLLDAVDALGAFPEHRAGVVEQHVDTGIPLADLIGQTFGLGQRGQVGDERIDRRRRRSRNGFVPAWPRIFQRSGPR